MLDILELKAFIGYSMLAGQKKKMLFYVNVLTHGLPLFRATISKYRFEFLLSY